MPSKKSKRTGTRNFQSSAARICSEEDLRGLAAEIAEVSRTAFREGKPLPRVVLRGPMGAGKSSFARAVLDELRVDRASEGSPTFAISHEYHTADRMIVVHADAYRLKTEEELEATGLVEALWNPERLVMIEWMDLFPVTEEALLSSDLPLIRVELSFTEEGALLREIRVATRHLE